MIRFKTEATAGTIRCPYCGKCIFLTGEKAEPKSKKRRYASKEFLEKIFG